MQWPVNRKSINVRDHSPMKRKRVRQRVKDYAGGPSGECYGCRGHFDHLEMDHITPWWEGGPHSLSNLQWLCERCHKKKSAVEMRRWHATKGREIDRTKTPEQRAAVGAFFRGRKQSPEHVQKRADAVRRANASRSPDERMALSEKFSAILTGRKIGPMPEDQKQRIGEAQRQSWAMRKSKSPLSE